MELDQLPPTVSVEQAAEIIGISRSSGYRAAERGELPTIRLGGRLHVPTQKLLALLGYGQLEDDQVVTTDNSGSQGRNGA